MSINGRFTSLQMNAYSGMLQNQGFTINPATTVLQGSWTPSTYTAGTVTENTVLKKLSDSLPLFLASVPARMSVTVWRSLLTLGSGVCPALANTRPATFIPTYAGYGTWKNATVDAYGNVTGPGPLTKTNDTYPPLAYGSEKTYSYIYQQKGDYAWITAWPGKNAWQQSDDDFAAAYAPTISDTSLIDYDSYFGQGFVATVSRQAYYEFWYNYATRRTNQYAEFVQSIQNYTSFIQTQNSTISSLNNNLTFLKGNYSNINDLTTSDITGVNLATRDWGNDLIRLGKSIDLANIHLFGLPSKLLLNLQRNNALTESVKFSLLYNELSTTELNNILNPNFTPTQTQEKKIYQAFKLVQAQDLNEVKIILNCTTPGLQSLADLLDPKHMFPVSYSSLTIPEYTTASTSYKIYKLIYTGTGVNSDITNWGGYLSGILPPELSRACGAFMMSMNQIKNIRKMDFEKFSQVVQNLEITNKDLSLINSTEATPGNNTLTNSGLAQVAFGTGNGGTYKFCDFLGAMSGIPYINWWTRIQQLIQQLTTSTLSTIYQNLYTLAADSLYPNYDVVVTGLVANANAEIAAIAAANPDAVEELNYYWNRVGTQLAAEQCAIALALKQTSSVYTIADGSSIENFIKNLGNYAQETGPCDAATVLAAIGDLGNLAGQSLVASLRESRNVVRINNAGGEVDNSLPDTLPPDTASATAVVTNGQITGIQITSNGSGYGIQINTAQSPENYAASLAIGDCDCCEPTAQVSPQGGVFGGSGGGAQLETVLDNFGSIRKINIINPGSDYQSGLPPPIYIENPPEPIRLGNATEPGSFAGSPYTGQDPVSTNLISNPDSSYTVAEAQTIVSECS